jgi:ubiquinone/menaquinone biosynthesis C-methylase UbiE
MTTQTRTRIGENWVTNPHRVLADIESEFDETAHEYEDSSAAWDYRGARDGSAFFAALVPTAARVLDAGCGTGLVGRGLAARGFSRLTGCDISSAMLAKAQAKGVYSGGCHKADIGRMPFADASFDALVCIAVLTYAASIARIFAEFDRVVRPGGAIVFSHRVDLEGDCGFPDALARRLESQAWERLAVSEPQLYYPRKEDYLDRITVRYHGYRRQ